MKTTLKNFYDNNADTSTKLSILLRNINFGLFILCGGMLLQTSAVSATWLPRRGLISICGLSILSLFLDYLQLLMGYMDSGRVISETEKRAGPNSDAETTQAGYDPNACTYKAWHWFFNGKQIITTINVIVFLTLAAYKLFVVQPSG